MTKVYGGMTEVIIFCMPGPVHLPVTHKQLKGRFMNDTIQRNPVTVAQMVISQPGATEVFIRNNIDFCCGGHRTLHDACFAMGLDPEEIKQEILRFHPKNHANELHPENWSSSFLIDFIIQNHHTYVRKALPEILALLDKSWNAHGNECMELLTIRDLFLDLTKELTDHMDKEELIVFPALRRSESGRRKDHPLAEALPGPLHALEEEHLMAGILIKEIRALTNHYSPPDLACATFRLAYQKLEEFELDLMTHVHLENNILFARYMNSN